MHYLEALLCLAEVTERPRYLERADECVGLLTSRFIEPSHGAIVEHFDETWSPVPGGTVCEPGHHYEWIWLLRRWQRLSRCDVDTVVDGLYRHAASFGHDPEGFIVDELDVTGHVTKPSRRVWPHAEGVKANAVEHEHGRPGSPAQAHRLLDVLLERFLSVSTAGGWMDRLTEHGAPADSYMPASTLYHVIFAVAAARVFSPGAATRHHGLPGQTMDHD